METFFIRALQLILSLVILIILHELGHFSFARLFKVRVNKFYLFYNPSFSLIRAKKINGKWEVKFFSKNVPLNERSKLDESGKPLLDKKGNEIKEPIPLSDLSDGDWRKTPKTTEWGIGWLPLGGYCKIAGMVDESMDITTLQSEPQPYEYRARPIWQRFFIITGGVLVNFLLALVIYAMVLFTWGKEYIPIQNAKYGIQFSETLQDIGLKNGDKIVSIDGHPIKTRSEAVEAILLDDAKSALVQRDGKQIEVPIPSDISNRVLASGNHNIIDYRFPFVVERVLNDSPAEKAHLQKGDSLVAINGEEYFIYQDITQQLFQSAGKTVNLSLVRGKKTIDIPVNLTTEGKIGVLTQTPLDFIETEKREYSLLQSVPAGIKMGMETLANYVKQFKLVFTKEGSKQVGGFGAIGSLFPSTWDWQQFWLMTAFISIALAFMNILPIPVLDGGYVLFLIYEAITGRKPSEKFIESTVSIGFFLLMGLMLYANGNDVIKAIF